MNPWDRAAKQIGDMMHDPNAGDNSVPSFNEIIRHACEEWAHLACENYRHRESVLRGILQGQKYGLEQTQKAAREIPERLGRLITRMEKL
jgi:hypothetical protein